MSKRTERAAHVLPLCHGSQQSRKTWNRMHG
jgi:hypothetical protein